MLSEKQLQKLQALIDNSRFGFVLKDAIEVWKRDDVVPVYGTFGVCHKNKTYDFYKTKCCCLLGAAYYGKSIDEELLTLPEESGIVKGFDDTNYDYLKNHDVEALEFGKEVREIVKPIHYSNVK